MALDLLLICGRPNPIPSYKTLSFRPGLNGMYLLSNLSVDENLSFKYMKRFFATPSAFDLFLHRLPAWAMMTITTPGVRRVLRARQLSKLLLNAPLLSLSRLHVTALMSQAHIVDGMVNYVELVSPNTEQYFARRKSSRST